MDVHPLGPGFFAELRGVAIADVAHDDRLNAAVRAAFEAHSVVLFRDQTVSDEVQAAYSRRFGPLETTKAASLGEGTPYSILTNIDRESGSLIPPGHKEDLRARANQLWHTDSSFKSPPALASVLSARASYLPLAVKRNSRRRVSHGSACRNHCARDWRTPMRGTITHIREERSHPTLPPSAKIDVAPGRMANALARSC